MKLFKPKIQVFSLVCSKIDFEERRNEIFIEKTSRSKDKYQQKKSTKLAPTNQVVGGCEKFFQKVESSSTFCNNVVLCFTSFSGHRPAQREWARTGLLGPMQSVIPTESHNPERLAPTPSESTSPTLFEQWCGFFYVQQEQISESVVRRDLQFFVLIRLIICSYHNKGSTFFSVI